jgi:hypothetical protein
MVKVGLSTLGVSMPLVLLWWWLLPLSPFIWIVLAGLLIGFFLSFFRIQQVRMQNQKNEEMYYWLQNFLTTLAVKKTITEAFMDVVKRYQWMKLTWVQAYASNEAMQALTNLKQRFQHPLYAIFVSTLAFYEQQGGDVMSLFDSILQQNRLIESRRMSMMQVRKRYLFQWLFLWLMNLTILMLAKVVLQDLFWVMESSVMFQSILAAIFLFLPFSFTRWIHQWQNAITKLQ